MKDYTVHCSFYEQGAERLITSVDHAQVPRVGDLVWLSGWIDDERDIACWEVLEVVWHYTSPDSMNGREGNMGGIVDILVRRSNGIFK